MPVESGFSSEQAQNWRSPASIAAEKASESHTTQREKPVAVDWADSLHEVLAKHQSSFEQLNKAEAKMLADYAKNSSTRLADVQHLSKEDFYAQVLQANQLLEQIHQVKTKEIFANNRVENAQNTLLRLTDLLHELSLSPLTALTKQVHAQQLATLINKQQINLNELKNFVKVHQQKERSLFANLNQVKSQLSEHGIQIEADKFQLEKPAAHHRSQAPPTGENVPGKKETPNTETIQVPADTPELDNQAQPNLEETEGENQSFSATAPTAESSTQTDQSEHITAPELTTEPSLTQPPQSEPASQEQENNSQDEEIKQNSENQPELASFIGTFKQGLNKLEQQKKQVLEQIKQQYTQELNLNRAQQIENWQNSIAHNNLYIDFLDQLIAVAKKNQLGLKANIVSTLSSADNKELFAPILEKIALYSQGEDITPTELNNVKIEFINNNDSLASMLELSQKLSERQLGISDENNQVQAESTGNLNFTDERKQYQEETSFTQQTQEEMGTYKTLAKVQKNHYEDNQMSEDKKENQTWLNKAKSFLVHSPLASLRNLFARTGEKQTSERKSSKKEKQVSLSIELPLDSSKFASENKDFVVAFNQQIGSELNNYQYWLENLAKNEGLLQQSWGQQAITDRLELKKARQNGQEQNYYADIPKYDHHQQLDNRFDQIQGAYTQLSRQKRLIDYYQDRQNEVSELNKKIVALIDQVNAWQLPNQKDKENFNKILQQNWLKLRKQLQESQIDKKLAEAKAAFEWQEQLITKEEKQFQDVEQKVDQPAYLPALQRYNWDNRELSIRKQTLQEHQQRNLTNWRFEAGAGSQSERQQQLRQAGVDIYENISDNLLKQQLLDEQIKIADRFLTNKQVISLTNQSQGVEASSLRDKALAKLEQITAEKKQLEAEKQQLNFALEQSFNSLEQIIQQAENEQLQLQPKLLALQQERTDIHQFKDLLYREKGRETAGRLLDAA